MADEPAVARLLGLAAAGAVVALAIGAVEAIGRVLMKELMMPSNGKAPAGPKPAPSYPPPRPCLLDSAESYERAVLHGCPCPRCKSHRPLGVIRAGAAVAIEAR